MCVCVCERERECVCVLERERQTDRQTGRIWDGDCDREVTTQRARDQQQAIKHQMVKIPPP